MIRPSPSLLCFSHLRLISQTRCFSWPEPQLVLVFRACSLPSNPWPWPMAHGRPVQGPPSAWMTQSWQLWLVSSEGARKEIPLLSVSRSAAAYPAARSCLGDRRGKSSKSTQDQCHCLHCHVQSLWHVALGCNMAQREACRETDSQHIGLQGNPDPSRSNPKALVTQSPL